MARKARTHSDSGVYPYSIVQRATSAENEKRLQSGMVCETETNQGPVPWPARADEPVPMILFWT